MPAYRRDYLAYWRERAACLHADPELFFPAGNSTPTLNQIAEAKTVCRTCPVAAPCLEWALRLGQVHGIWGGTTERERREMRRAEAPEQETPTPSEAA
ncbi:WhiB family transcriptional regulator [Streptomyces sp. WMMC500]|uniref:WhiB family transcriptional regulator n=1 Tax=Streptomyces sp. WMMC500 TaxID=3015154 RepID=UPI00248CB44F|nr:WhiB family transcriptional regulator [Streptomyces sp. WMMC500]WBB62480.1 WhiB family transcriptional regulator [Streptomyces sp. WMMC500]